LFDILQGVLLPTNALQTLYLVRDHHAVSIP
jgi:hypothetical protein